MRTRIAFVAVGVLVAQPFLIFNSAVGAVPGDVDGDTHVTANDARLAAMISGGLFKSLAPNVASGDVASATGNTPDGRISLVDAVRILRAVNGLDTLGGTSSGLSAVPLRDPSVAITSNLTRNYTLPGGFTLSGTAKSTLGLSITSQPGSFPMTSGSLSFTDSGNAFNSASGSAAAGTGNYSAVLAAGSYNVKVVTQVLDIDFQTGAFSNYSLQQTATPSTVAISATKTQNFVRPDLPATGTVAGTIMGSDVVPQNVTFTLSSGSGSGSGPVEADAFSVVVPPGQGYLTIQSDYAGDVNVSVTAHLGAAPVTVVAGSTVTRDVTIPALGSIHGNITTPAGTSLSSVSAGANVPGPSTTTDQYDSSYFPPTTDPNAYRLALPAGTYPVTILLDSTTTGTSSMMASYITEAVFGTGDTLKDFTLPALPSSVTFSGVVKGPDGAVLNGATLMLITHQSGAPTSGYFVLAQGTTNVSGAFSIAVPAGTYDVSVTPPRG